jgi:hypothetical protein
MSPRFSLNKTDIEKILKGACIAAGGALLAYIADLIPQIDYGPYTILVVALGSVLVNAAIKFLQAQSTPEVPQE